METSWLLELLKQGGLAAVAGIALWLLHLSHQDRISAEKRSGDERVELERKHGEERLQIEQRSHSETRQMWLETKAAIAESNRLISAFMERFQVQQPEKPARRKVERVDNKEREKAV